MKTINEHISKQNFKNVYLIFGEEGYLRRQYKNKLREAILPLDDTMNSHLFTGKGIDVEQVLSLADTLPFFAQHRLILLENTGFFTSSDKSGNQKIADYMQHIPETTIFIFVEEEVDKRNKLYKAVNKAGYAAEMKAPDQKTLMKWVGLMFSREKKKITEKNCLLFLSLIDLNMDNVSHEAEKLICYTMGRDVITEEDIYAICTVHTENKIFDMINAVAAKNKNEALSMYNDLLILREAPMKILSLIIRQFKMLMHIKEISRQGASPKVIAERIGVRDFVVRKNMGLADRFDLEQLREAVEYSIELEEAVKTGKLADKIAVEMIIYKYTRRL